MAQDFTANLTNALGTSLSGNLTFRNQAESYIKEVIHYIKQISLGFSVSRVLLNPAADLC